MFPVTDIDEILRRNAEMERTSYTRSEPADGPVFSGAELLALYAVTKVAIDEFYKPGTPTRMGAEVRNKLEDIKRAKNKLGMMLGIEK